MVALSIFDASHKNCEAHPHLVKDELISKASVPSRGLVQEGLFPTFLPENNSDPAHGAGSFQPHHNNATIKKRHLEDLCTSLLQHVPTVAVAKAYL